MCGRIVRDSACVPERRVSDFDAFDSRKCGNYLPKFGVFIAVWNGFVDEGGLVVL